MGDAFCCAGEGGIAEICSPGGGEGFGGIGGEDVAGVEGGLEEEEVWEVGG